MVPGRFSCPYVRLNAILRKVDIEIDMTVIVRTGFDAADQLGDGPFFAERSAALYSYVHEITSSYCAGLDYTLLPLIAE
jgi:hypothetical protein